MDELKDKFYTRRDFAKMIGISDQLLTYHIKNGNIETFENGNHVYILNNKNNKLFVEFYKQKKENERKFRKAKRNN